MNEATLLKFLIEMEIKFYLAWFFVKVILLGSLEWWVKGKFNFKDKEYKSIVAYGLLVLFLIIISGYP